jgi:hypothetical protein
MVELAAMAVAADQRSAQATERCRALSQMVLSQEAYEKTVEKAEIEASEHCVELYLNAHEVIQPVSQPVLSGDPDRGPEPGSQCPGHHRSPRSSR